MPDLSACCVTVSLEHGTAGVLHLMHESYSIEWIDTVVVVTVTILIYCMQRYINV